MTRSEQRESIRQLRDCMPKMKREDLYDFEMLLKRDRDDEDLDSLAAKKLHDLYERYLPKKDKRDIDALLKKYIDQQRKSDDQA